MSTAPTPDCPHDPGVRVDAALAGTCPVCLAADRNAWRDAARTAQGRLATVRHLAAGKPGRFAAVIVSVCDGGAPP